MKICFSAALQSFGESGEESYLHEARVSERSSLHSRSRSHSHSHSHSHHSHSHSHCCEYEKYEDFERRYSFEEDRKMIEESVKSNKSLRSVSKKTSGKSLEKSLEKSTKDSVLDRCYPCVPGKIFSISIRY